MILLLLTGALSGLALGYVLQRGGLCFHSMFLQGVGGAGPPRFFLLPGRLLGVAPAAVGLAIVDAGGLGEVGRDLNRGLAFRPVGTIGGGLMIGVGMALVRLGPLPPAGSGGRSASCWPR